MTERRTFYDEDLSLPELPNFDFALDDGPSCHQSLKFWSAKASEIGETVLGLANSVDAYYQSGVIHHQKGIGFSTALGEVAKAFQHDDKISEPIIKFSDMLQRIECYRDMLLNQTQLLTWQPLETLAGEYEKAKELQAQVIKAQEVMHIAWEKFSNCQHVTNLPEPAVLDKLAHAMLVARQNYQKMMIKYIATLREIHLLKKITLLQKVLEHMLAQFSFFNFAYQTIKDMEPYMNDLFKELQTWHSEVEQKVQDDCVTKTRVEAGILERLQKDGQAFGEPQTQGLLGQSVSTMNVQAGKIFTKIGDLFQSSSFSISGKRGSGSHRGSQGQDLDWEVVENPTHTSSPKPERKRPHEGGRSGVSAPKGEEERATDNSSPKPPPRTKKTASKTVVEPVTEANQEKVLSVVTDDLLPLETAPSHNHSTDVAKDSNTLPQQSITNSITQDTSSPPSDGSLAKGVVALSAWEGCKKGYLRIRQKAFPKPKWPLLYFIVDKSSGQLLAQGQDQSSPSVMENLLLSTVKICDLIDVDRNFCFQLISPSSDRMFQALTDQDVQGWVAAIQEATAEALKNSKAKLQSLARSHLDQQTTETKKYISNASLRVKKVEGNQYCADCSMPRPDWASINLGVTVCIECSGVHRSLGVHVSKVRSLTLDKWDEKTVEFMEKMGNAKINSLYESALNEHKKPTRDSSKDERHKYIRLKYVDRKFCSHPGDIEHELVPLMPSRPGDMEEELLNDSTEMFPDRSLLGSSPLCLVEDCKECPSSSCIHKEEFAASQLIVSDPDVESESEC